MPMHDYHSSHVVPGHEGDGEPPRCFTDVASTGIPEIQGWCRHIGSSRRQNSYHGAIEELLGLARTIRSYVEGISESDVAQDDADAMKKAWQSDEHPNAGGMAKRLQQVSKTPRERHEIFFL